MAAQLDHLIIGGPDLDDLEAYVEEQLGVAPRRGGSHPGWGTRNSLVGLGGRQYLELVAPDPDQPDPEHARSFRVDELTEPTLVGWAVRVDDVGSVVAHAREQGYDPGEPFGMSRRTADGRELAWQMTPTDTGRTRAVPFLIDWGQTPHPSEGLPAVLLQTFRIKHPQAPELNAAFKALGVARGPIQLRVGEPVRLSAVLMTESGRVELG
ncbi:MAG TPA: VOC family protein [Ornithinicoccus sp.]|nr:VOC family protein [Ornithinicoccus sp.]